jgi:hypothetical protein
MDGREPAELTVNLDVRFRPKADIRTESKSVFLNVRFGEKSGHSVLEGGLIEADFS